MNPVVAVGLAIQAIDQIISLIKHIQGQSTMTTDQIIAQADAQDLANREAIKALLAL